MNNIAAGIIPHYQPIVRLHDKKVIMYECLARFIGPDGHGVGPTDIMHMFDDHEFLWDVLENTIPSILAKFAGPYKTSISINVDPCTLNGRFFYFFEHLFYRHPNLANFINFEITEKNIALAIDTLGDNIRKIQELGSKVYLDDFGTGSANLDTLRLAHFDGVKIDGQFLTAAEKNPLEHERLEYIVKLLKSYKTKIIAEHVENENIFKIAKNLGIDYGQGHLFGFPSSTIQIDNEYSFFHGADNPYRIVV